MVGVLEEVGEVADVLVRHCVHGLELELPVAALARQLLK
jgi:hypothetical protein